MANPTEEHQEEEKEGSNNFTCGICIETKSSNKRFSISNKCAHSFCTDCMKIYIHVKVEADVAVDIKCPGSNCKEFLDPLSCRPLLRHQTFNKWCDNIFESALLRFDRCYCPYKDCSALVVNECGGTPKRSECPNCKRLFCFQCKIPYHWSYHCADVGKIEENNNDILFEQLVKRKKWIRCPECRYFVERTSGCSRIICRCHTNFCYNCGETSKCKHDEEMDPLIIVAVFLCVTLCLSFAFCLLYFTTGF